MTDKQQIEELTKDLSILQNCGMVIIESQMDWRGSTHKEIKNKVVAEALYNAGYRKVPEGAVVLAKEEKKRLLDIMYQQGRIDAMADLEAGGAVVLTQDEIYEFRKDQAEVKFLKKQIQEQARKEKAKEILTEWADCDCETGGYNLPYIHELAKKYGVEVE